MTDGEREIVTAMAEEGGGFVKTLAHCFLLADPDNFKRLYEAFPEYWRTYTKIAVNRRLTQRDGAGR